MRGYYINERIVAKEGQQIIKLDKPFNEKAIVVHLNERLINNGITTLEYLVEDNYTIKFNFPLIEGDVININSLFYSTNINVKVISANKNNPNSIFHKYGDKEKLKFNHKYNIKVALKDKIISWNFVSKLNPYMSTVKKIRLDTGELLNNVEDEKIAMMIYLNSKEIITIYNDLMDGDFGVGEESYPKYLNTWVRYKTDLDLCYAFYLTLTGQCGSNSKSIGPISVSNLTKLPYLKDMLSRFKDKFDKVDDLLKPEGESVVNIVKAKGMAYPLNSRRLP